MSLTLKLKRDNVGDDRLGDEPMNKTLKQLDIDELTALCEQIEADPEKTAGLLFPDNHCDRVHLTKKIGQWAINQALVIESSLSNKTDVALIFDKAGNRIWQQLPSYARRITVNIE
jgi:hypothetical protein